MIEELTMCGVASYRAPTTLRTTKRVNLIYGLNGSGKSTISDYFADPGAARFAACRLSPQSQTSRVIAYNQRFIRENFYEADSVRGIFSLSKQNKEAAEKVASATRRLEEIQAATKLALEDHAAAKSEIARVRKLAAESTWKIKKDYTGGDRVLEFCLEGLKGDSDKLLSFMLSIPLPTAEPKRSMAQLKEQASALTSSQGGEQSEVREFMFGGADIENDQPLREPILGSSSNAFSELIEKLGNADWVRSGLEYTTGSGHPQDLCPFCQERTLPKERIDELKAYFDDFYARRVSKIEHARDSYKSLTEALPTVSVFASCPSALKYEPEIKSAIELCKAVFSANLAKFDEKLRYPSAEVTLLSSVAEVGALNSIIGTINHDVESWNSKIKNRVAELGLIRKDFWDHMRVSYRAVTERYLDDEKAAQARLRAAEKSMDDLRVREIACRAEIAVAQSETVNVDEAIANINSGLLELGIDGFCIEKHAEHLYRVVRPEGCDGVLKSLSEGERMMISFLYFCELCRGRVDEQDTTAKRIAVIDDPVSSLSHIYLFNIGRLLRTFFFKDEIFEQVFVLTHSLYFFHELTDTNHQRRAKEQALFRLAKNSEGSFLFPMSYEEIQNDYQAYWAYIKDPSNPPALLANCMRNVVEYFFGFVRKYDINNVFQDPELQTNRLQAFCRFVNRESHSIGQNVFDIKEFNYEEFKDGLRLVFKKTGYEEHYTTMIG